MRPTHSLKKLLSLAGLLALTGATATAAPLPAELPPVDPAAPVAKDKPVKVYILSGQSNMLGFGRIEGASPTYLRVFFSADPTARNYILPVRDNALLGMKLLPAKGNDAIALGSTEATVPAGTIEAELEVPVGGRFEVNVGLDDSSYAIATVDGQEVYRKTVDGDVQLSPVTLKKGQRHSLRIDYEKGGSAALWLEKVDLKGMGDLRWVVEELGRFKSLMNAEGEWVVRTDVIHTDAYMGKGKSEPLSAPACGRSIGPELGFGWVMGEFHDEPVIVLKADIGNRSLGWDMLPPGSETWEHEGKTYPGYGLRLDKNGNPVQAKKGEWYAGKQYDEFTAAVHEVLDNFDTKFPQFKDQGYEIGGFVWWQGHKDGPNPGHNAMYERNLANLIRAWRQEFNAPDADWTIATVGFQGEDMVEHYRRIAQAQLNVADPKRHPELAGDVKTIDIRPFWRPAGMSPKSQHYHYHHNAETYMLVGDALGRAMVELKGGEAEYPSGQLDASINYIPDLSWPESKEVAAMQPALKPILLQAIIPGYMDWAGKMPPYLRSGRPMEQILANQAPENPPRAAYKLHSDFDQMIEYYEMAGIEAFSWKAVDPEALSAEWDYYSFDPEEPAPTKGTLTRYRDITLPTGIENWTAVNFDASRAGWKTGKAPFGQKNGQLRPLRRHCGVSYCQCDRMPNTKWENEVLLMRTRMKIPEFDPNYRYRLVVGGAGHVWTGEGYALCINGEQVSEMKSGYYYRGGGKPRGVLLFEDFQRKYGGQEVTVALKGFLRMSGYKKRPAPPEGHLNVWVQAAKVPPALLSTFRESSTE